MFNKIKPVVEISNRIFLFRSDRSDHKSSGSGYQAGEKTGTRNWKPEIQMPDSEIQMLTLTDNGKLVGAIKKIKRFL